MKLEAGKKYKTRDGTILKCVSIWEEKVRGYQATLVNNYAESWIYTLDGHFSNNTTYHHRDIIAEYKEPKKFEAWVNFYADGGICWAWSKEAADAEAEDTKTARIECRKIEWEVPDNG